MPLSVAMTPYRPLGPRAGATLLELLTALATVALMIVIALPKIGQTFSHSAVKAARGDVASKFQLARLLASQGGRTAILRISGSQVWVETRPRTVPAVGSIADTVGGVADLRVAHAVAVNAAPDSVVYNAHGIAASGGNVVLHRAGVTDSVQVNALGLVIR